MIQLKKIQSKSLGPTCRSIQI